MDHNAFWIVRLILHSGNIGAGRGGNSPAYQSKNKKCLSQIGFFKSKNAIKLLMASVRTKGCNVWETNINRQCARKGMQHLQ